MKRCFCIGVLFILLVPFARGADIRIREPLALCANDISAQQYRRTDKNDEICALIKVRTPIRDMKFDSRWGITGDITYKSGEYWVYISVGERVLQLMHEQLMRLDYPLPLRIESGQVYRLVIEADLPDQETAEKILYGNLSVMSLPAETQGADIRINGSETSRTTPAMFSLQEGVYTVSIHKDEYETVRKSVTIHANEDLQLTVNLEKTDPLKQYRKQLRTQKIISGILLAVSLGSGIYTTVKGDEAYRNYRTSTDPEAIAGYKNDSQRYDQIAIVSYSVSLASAAWFCTSLVKSIKLK